MKPIDARHHLTAATLAVSITFSIVWGLAAYAHDARGTGIPGSISAHGTQQGAANGAREQSQQKASTDRRQAKPQA
jgi:hypothetical protein